jgi:hypothetical protein
MFAQMTTCLALYEALVYSVCTCSSANYLRDTSAAVSCSEMFTRVVPNAAAMVFYYYTTSCTCSSTTKCSSIVSAKHLAGPSELLERLCRLETLSSTVQIGLSFACRAYQTEGVAQHLVLCGGLAAAAQLPRTQCCCSVFGVAEQSAADVKFSVSEHAAVSQRSAVPCSAITAEHTRITLQ